MALPDCRQTLLGLLGSSARIAYHRPTMIAAMSIHPNPVLDVDLDFALD